MVDVKKHMNIIDTDKKIKKILNVKTNNVLKQEIKKGEEVLVSELPKCDICGEKAKYDSKTKSGPWGYLCEKHYEEYGVGKLGVGFGQKLILRE